MLERARQFGADPTALAGEENCSRRPARNSEAEARAREQAAQLVARKEKVLVQAQANQVGEALGRCRACARICRRRTPSSNRRTARYRARVRSDGFRGGPRGALRRSRSRWPGGGAIWPARRGRSVMRDSAMWRYRAINDTVRKRSDVDTRGDSQGARRRSRNRRPEEVIAVTRRWVSTFVDRVQAAHGSAHVRSDSRKPRTTWVR